MTTVDSHCHALAKWYEPAETLLFQMDRLGIAKALVTQLIGHYNNTEQLALCADHADRLAGVVAIDPAAPDPAGLLQHAVAAGAVGVRIGAAVANDALWQAAAQLGVPVSVSGTASALVAPGFVARVAATPQAQFVLEHLGGIGRPDFDGTDETRAAVLALSRFANVALKLPGLGQLGKRTALSNDPPIEPGAAATVHAALDAFGADRLLWGSDFPPVASREGYGHALRWVQRALAALTPDQQAAIFGGNAVRLFKLKA